MKKIIILLALIAAQSVILNAQNIETIILDSKSAEIVESSATVVGQKYTITISGTYSMWPSYDSYGVDATYLYDVPHEEINALRWPPQELFGQKLYELPYWLGQENEFPPIEIPGIKAKFVSRDHIGFRINGNWLPDVGFDGIAHTYKVEYIGDGNPFKFQILDSSYDVSLGRVIARHEDNSGSLTIEIESEPEIEICDVEFICENNQIVGVKLSAALFEYTDENGNRINTLKEGNESKLGIAFGGEFICPDSIRCDSRVEGSFSWSMVFDVSGSMDDVYGNSTKINALKNSANRFIDGFHQNDEAMLITFNDQVYLSSDWTSDFGNLKGIINSLTPFGYTAYYDAGMMGVERTYVRNNPNKAMILLSDGEDNRSVSTIQQLVNTAQNRNIKIYTIGVSLFPEVQESMEYIANQTGGKSYSANDPNAMDSVFTSIQQEVTSDECCTIYFTLPQTILEGEKPRYENITILAFDKDGKIISTEEQVLLPKNCDDIASTIEERIDQNYYQELLGINVEVSPIPAKDNIMIRLNSNELRTVKLDLIDNNGNEFNISPVEILNSGEMTYNYNTGNMPNGSYLLRVGIDGQYQIFEKLIIVK